MAQTNAPLRVKDTSPALVLILSIVTCGLYLIYWYYSVYSDLNQLDGRTPTGNAYFIDFLLMIVTCGIWGIYVDYRISQQLNELQEKAGLAANDTTALVIILDVAAYVTIAFTYMISSAIQQDQLNKVMNALAAGGSTPGSDPYA
jgi:Domain of unknown function (DUF4234)